MNTEVRDYIASLGTLLQEGATSSEKQKLYSITPSASYIDNPDKIGENNAGYYEMESARIREHASAVVTDIVPPTGSEGAIYPGALVQGKSVSEGEPVLIPIYDKRKTGRISLNVVSGDKSGISEEIRTFTKSEVGEAMNRIIGNYKSGFPANTAITYRAVHTLDEMAYHLGLDASVLRENFEPACRRTATTKIMVRLSQIFFTMTYDQPGINDMFTTRLSVDELQRYCGTGNPPAYISSVSYGRCFVLLYESQAVSEPVLTATISGVYCNEKDTLGITPRQRDIFKNKISNVTLLQIGGNAEAGLATVFGDFNKLREFIINGAEVSPQNVGAPISYHIKYLHDNTDAKLSNTLKYKVTTKQYYQVDARNNIAVDFLKLKVSRIRPVSRKYHVSTNCSYVKIKSISVDVHRLKNNKYEKLDSYDIFEANADKVFVNGYGADIPLNSCDSRGTMYLGDRITIQCKVEVHNEIYYWGRTKETQLITLQRTFICNNKGQWESLEDIKPAKDAFTSIKKTEIIASAEVDLDLQIRFSQDGVVLGRD